VVDGFFDAGMLLQADKSNEMNEEKNSPAATLYRKEIGRKLRLAID